MPQGLGDRGLYRLPDNSGGALVKLEASSFENPLSLAASSGASDESRFEFQKNSAFRVHFRVHPAGNSGGFWEQVADLLEAYPLPLPAPLFCGQLRLLLKVTRACFFDRRFKVQGKNPESSQ